MTDRSILYAQEQTRSYDFISFEHDVMIAMAAKMLDTLGAGTTVVGGLAATQTTTASLTINLAAGRIYQMANADTATQGQIPQDLQQIMQQGFAAAQTVTLSTSGIGVGQSRWALIQAQFSQADSVRSGDPNGGVMAFYNSSNPSSPLNGQGGLGGVLPTVRQGLMSIQVVNGTAATTGSETPPSATSGWVGLYLIDLTYGQTAVTNAQILVAGPSVGTGVSSAYPAAPFLAGLLSSHHAGTTGQAPKIKLASEVQGTLPLANHPASGTLGGLSAVQIYAGNPNGHVAGNTWGGGLPADTCYDITNGGLWICTTTGTTSTAVWKPLQPGRTIFDLSSPPSSDIVLGVSEKVIITGTGVSSWPLHVAVTPGQIFKMRVFISSSNSTNTDIYFRPNNTTYTNAFSWWIQNNVDQNVSSLGSAGALANFTANPTSPYVGNIASAGAALSATSGFYHDMFGGPTGSDNVNDIGAWTVEWDFVTTTTSKWASSKGAIAGGPSGGFGKWVDTTTAWTSLGTLVDVNATSMTGTIIVERLA